MGGQLLHVINLQPVGVEDTLYRPQREVVEVLVINGVKLALLNQPEEVGELHGDRPAGGQHRTQPLHKAVDIRDVGQHIVADYQVVEAVPAPELPGGTGPEKAAFHLNSLFPCFRRHIFRRLNALDGDAIGLEVLQQVAIVAGNFQHMADRRKGKAGDDHIHIRLAVGQPAPGVGAEILVLPENLLRPPVFGGLNQKALAAHLHIQRIKHLPTIQIVLFQVLVGQRGQAQVGKSMLQLAAAKAAVLVIQFHFLPFFEASI